MLSGLKPEKVFHYFEEIAGIPHGSGNMEQISGYLAEFAKKRGLFYVQDEWKNIIIRKEASPGYENQPPVILQGHMDMVAVKKPDCDKDMTREGLCLAVRGDEIYAVGTSLGGDDGIAVAYSLALLDSDTLQHPRLEVVITVDEEVGMDGARNMDLSCLTGNRMINLDSEEEGIFLASCAGGARVCCLLPVKQETGRGAVLTLSVQGLSGGHSGAEIHKGRANAICLTGRILYRLMQEREVCLCSLESGIADNAIPREATAEILVREEDVPAVTELAAALASRLKEEFAGRDPLLSVELVRGETGERRHVTLEDTRRTAAFLCAVPYGVQAMSADMPELVETSLNPGILRLEGDGESGELRLEFSVRSSVESAKQALTEKLRAITELAGGNCQVSGDYPGWKYRKDSPLREKMAAVYEEMYGTPPRVEAIHAGLECGILGSKIKDLDCVSIGPQMTGIHTVEETLSISSTARVWEFLVRLLEKKD